MLKSLDRSLLSGIIVDSIVFCLQLLEHPTQELVVLGPHLVVVAKSQVDQQLTEIPFNVCVDVCRIIKLQEVL